MPAEPMNWAISRMRPGRLQIAEPRDRDRGAEGARPEGDEDVPEAAGFVRVDVVVDDREDHEEARR